MRVGQQEGSTQVPGEQSRSVRSPGDIPSIKWMWRSFPDETVVTVARDSRRLTRKAASFWALICDIPRAEARSLAKEERKDVSPRRH